MSFLSIVSIKDLVPGSLFFFVGRQDTPTLVLSNTRIDDDFRAITYIFDGSIFSLRRCRSADTVHNVILLPDVDII